MGVEEDSKKNQNKPLQTKVQKYRRSGGGSGLNTNKIPLFFQSLQRAET